ncbi:unnamed protein product [Blepharisma stoltei]|uniref:Group 1 truncated hemoglobin n=1 Tax=Blepharisma stoltei TaxID=1481888 RepID=A0AAU9K351_9CILI|nr:unnamed protein product [Blepharisma stoltei]
MATNFERVGGHNAVVALIDGLYSKILANPITAAAFAGKDVNHVKAMQVEYWSEWLGSGTPYTGRSMADGHRGLNLSKEQFDLVAGFLLATLRELNLDEAYVNAVMAHAGGLESEIINL